MNRYYPLFFLFYISSNLFAQVGIGTENPKATLDIVGNTATVSVPDGVIVPRITGTALRLKNASYGHEQNGTLVFVTAPDDSPADKTKNVLAKGFYYYYQPSASDTGEWIGLDTEKKYFYLPSIVLPINAASSNEASYNNDPTPQLVLDPNVVYNPANQTYTVDLYKAYSRQFNKTLYNSNGSDTTFVRNVLSRDKYEYHILYVDPVFTNITFSSGAGNEGKFTYKVNPSVIVKSPPFMNIVLKEK